MTSPYGRMRPARPEVHGVADLARTFALRWAGPEAPDVVVTGVTHASAEVEPGDLFVGLHGFKVHGATYARAAVDAGAVAVLTDPAGADLCGDLGVPVLLADDPRALLGDLAAWVYGHPATELVTVGITGTNGKTTTSYFVDAALRSVHPTTAVLGTVELRIGEEAIESPRTTVEA